MDTINIHEAKTQLSKLLVRVEFGEEIIIANRGVPVAKLVPIPHTIDRRACMGQDRLAFRVPDNFNVTYSIDD